MKIKIAYQEYKTVGGLGNGLPFLYPPLYVNVHFLKS